MKFLKSFFLAAFAALAPIHTIMAATGILIAMDMVLGVAAAHKRKEAITSAELRRTLSKMIIYQLALIAAFLVEHYLLDGSLPVIKFCAGAIGMVEIKSILENADTVNGSPIFAAIAQKLGSVNQDPPQPPSNPPPAA